MAHGPRLPAKAMYTEPRLGLAGRGSCYWDDGRGAEGALILNLRAGLRLVSQVGVPRVYVCRSRIDACREGAARDIPAEAVEVSFESRADESCRGGREGHPRRGEQEKEEACSSAEEDTARGEGGG